jgi:hypothetical protein
VKAKDGQGGDGFEAERWLVAYLHHLESVPKARRSGDETLVVVLPDGQVADRREKGKRQASSAPGGKNTSAG